MSDAEGAGAQEAPNALLCSLAGTIQGVMNKSELDRHEWLKIENFVSAKARELRTERLKRHYQPETTDVVQAAAVPRKILKIKRRE